MKPYRIVDESETHVTYEYRTAYTWALYVMLLIMVAGMVIPNDVLTIVGGAGIAIYFIAKLALGNEANNRIREAMRSNAVQLSGSKASFRSPLRIRVPR
jgi:ABC-type bacteriocin/lantibiotic exporter with double-glycine peptidase domain